MTTTSIPNLMLQPITDCLTPEVARRVVEAKLDPATQTLIDELANKANRGCLSDDERAQYAEFVEYIDIVGIFKAKARSVLNRNSS